MQMDLDAIVDQYLGLSSSSPARLEPYHAAPLSRPPADDFQMSPPLDSRRLFTESTAQRRGPNHNNNSRKKSAGRSHSKSPSPTGGQHQSTASPSLRTNRAAPVERVAFFEQTYDGEVRTGGPSEVPYLSPSYNPVDGDPRLNSMLRRMQLWAERRDAKRSVMVYEKLQDESQECTFHPVRVTEEVSRDSSLLQASPLYKDNRAWGFDEFVDRLVTARTQREAKRAEDEARVAGATGSKWKPEPTVPEPFEFGRYLRRPIPSLKKPFDSLAPALREEHFNSVSTIEAPSVPSGLFSVQTTRVILDHTSKSPQK